MSAIFISYAHEDKQAADTVCAMLEQRGLRCWIAPRDVVPGVPYAESILDAISAARVVVLVFSSHANRSPHVLREIDRAVSKGLAILPLRLEDVALSKSMEYLISTPHWMDVQTPPLEQHIGRLADAIAILLDRGAAPRPSGAARDDAAPSPDSGSPSAPTPAAGAVPRRVPPARGSLGTDAFVGEVIRADGSRERYEWINTGTWGGGSFDVAVDEDGKRRQVVSIADVARVDIVGPRMLIRDGVVVKNIWAKATVVFRDGRSTPGHLNLDGLGAAWKWCYRRPDGPGVWDVDEETVAVTFEPK
jgi:hypothetical protein